MVIVTFHIMYIRYLTMFKHIMKRIVQRYPGALWDDLLEGILDESTSLITVKSDLDIGGVEPRKYLSYKEKYV